MDFFSSTASYRTFTLAARLLSISAYRRRVTKRQLFALDTEKFDPRSLPYRVTNTEQGRIVKISRHAEGGNAMFLHFDGKGRGWRLSFNLCLPRHLFIADVEYALAARIFARVDASDVKYLLRRIEIHAFNREPFQHPNFKLEFIKFNRKLTSTSSITGAIHLQQSYKCFETQRPI